MKIVCSPKGIVDKDRPRQGIMDIADAGFLDQGVICGLSEDETDVWGDAACEYRIVEPIVEDVEKDALWTVNREYYLSLLDEARTHNVKILLKNMCRNVGGHLIRGNHSQSFLRLLAGKGFRFLFVCKDNVDIFVY